MKSQNTKTSDRLQREVRQDLRNVRRDLESMAARISPGQFLDDAIFYRHGGTIRGSIDHLKNNPIGTTLLTLGTLLLMEDEDNETYENKLRNRAVEGVGRIKVHRSHGDLAARTARNDGDNTESSKEAVSSSDLSNWRSSDETPKAQKIKDGFSHAREKMSESIETSRETLRNLDPITYMALGAGLGVLTGAALPVSDREQSFVTEKMSARLSTLETDLRNAMDECTSVLTKLVAQDVKDFAEKMIER
jgi:hypothetical protein